MNVGASASVGALFPVCYCLAVGAIWGIITSTASEHSVAFAGSVASIIVLIHIEWVRARLRERKLRLPVEAHFTIRRSENSDLEPQPAPGEAAAPASLTDPHS
jgi:hypothetical protein